jgi:large subunit ribosomal protein L14
MIQTGTLLNVIDNSGARQVKCLKIFKGYKRRYAFAGDFVLVSVKNLREKRKEFSRVKKGDVCKALIVRAKVNSWTNQKTESLTFGYNAVILLSKQEKLLGTRIFGGLPQSLRQKSSIKLLLLSGGANL